MDTPHTVVTRLGAGTSTSHGLGGKGTALARLVGAGFPVPPTAVIGVDAYRNVVAASPLAERLHSIAAGAPPPSSDAIERLFLAAPVADHVVNEMVAAAAELGPLVAVRSSATAEDLAGQSFAGLYRSVLDVDATSADAVAHAVRLVWASLWHPAPVAYRRAWGVAEGDLAMAVVLMRMVPAIRAGVAFSHGPGGADATVRVEAVDGLGETLVSGQRTPDVWLLSRDTSVPVPSGPSELASVRELVLQVEAHEGAPVDVEWAHDGERTWLLQARPITAPADDGDGVDTAVDDHELTTAGIDEMLPGVLPPLRFEVNAHLAEEALRGTLQHLGALTDPEVQTRRFLRRVRGRAALDLDLLKHAATGIPGGTAAEIEREYFGAAMPDDEHVSRPARVRLLLRDARAARARRHALTDAAIVNAAVGDIVDGAPVLAELTDRALLAYRLRLVDLAVRAMTAELGVAAIAGGAYRRLERWLAHHVGADGAQTWAQSLTLGAGLPPSPPPSASRSVFAGPTWEEAGQTPPSAIGDPDLIVERRQELERELTSDPRWRRQRLLTGQVVDVRLHLLRRLIADTVDDLRIRERTKVGVLALGGEVRRVHLELGERLVARGLLAHVDDVELLVTVELRDALAGTSLPTLVLGRRRRRLTQWTTEPPLPERFHGRPAPMVEVASGDRLTGRPASPGVATGIATVVREPTDELIDGHILVAQATDAAWTPLFLRAAAVVVERGGPLSHAAILARELGLPAVLDVHGATGRLQGCTVTVDGTAGTVDVRSEPS